ncbi:MULTISPECIES: hypothetical protein [Shewanella]|uniref:hypothetical protein n=1 Tax=Shewanella TaxID=22 RepID=UPI001181F921|nr:hypothetical protein [Shewanella algae]MBO2661977.1 hypothetical protein [Shewanella algae]MCL1052731.1 hypothetical protein [Shewanella algae]
MDYCFNKLCLKPESSSFLAAWQRKLPPLFSGINPLKAVTFAPAAIDWCTQADKTIERTQSNELNPTKWLSEIGRVKSIAPIHALHSAAEQNIDKKDVE